MARRLTAKRRITKRRALSIIDRHIEVLMSIAAEELCAGHQTGYASNGISVLEELRLDVERRCEYGAFPSDD